MKSFGSEGSSNRHSPASQVNALAHLTKLASNLIKTAIITPPAEYAKMKKNKSNLDQDKNSLNVEILVFGVHETPLLLREVHMIDGTMLIMFLDRRNNENS